MPKANQVAVISNSSALDQTPSQLLTVPNYYTGWHQE